MAVFIFFSAVAIARTLLSSSVLDHSKEAWPPLLPNSKFLIIKIVPSLEFPGVSPLIFNLAIC